MSTFTQAMHADAMAAAQGYQHSYHPNQGHLHQDRVVDQGYIHDDTMMDNNDYINSNGYYAPPQAPRLTAAAARASSMAAMYYNPTLHPLHPLSSHVGGLDPWTASYHPGDFGRHSIPAPAYHHQQIEHQLMAQNKKELDNQVGYSKAASVYGLEQNQPDQYGPRYSYPHDQSQPSWSHAPSSAWAWKEQPAVQTSSYQRHLSDATPTGHRLNYGNSYFNYAEQANNSTADNGHHSHSHSLSLPAPAHTQENSGRSRFATQREGWNAAGLDWRHQYPANDYEGAWQGETTGWNQINDNGSSWNGNAAKNMADGWVPQALASHNDHSTLASSQAYEHRGDIYNEANNDVIAAPEQVEKRAMEEEPQNEPAVEKSATAAPEPPSPGTLDKSSVPISSVGAEMIWSASAVFLEPDLLVLCAKINDADSRSGRSRCTSAASITSSGKYTPSLTESDWALSPMQLSSDHHHHRSQRGTPTSQNLQRLTFGTGEAAANSEESSASSSEPGTPPSSFPAYMYDEAHQNGPKYGNKSFRRSQEARGLGLAAPDLTFAINRQMKDLAPSLERKSSQDRVQETVSSVFGLVSSDCRWSVSEDKFLSLSQSLRDGASQDALQNTTRSSHSARSMSPRSEDSPSSNSAPVTGSESSPAFRRFAHQVLAQTLVSPTAFMLAIMYSLRVPHLAIQTNSQGVAVLDAEAKEIFAHPPSAAPFKLFTLGLMIANKHLDDNTFLNKTWNEVTGISLSEINRMERWYLEKSSYEISVPEDSWVTFLERLAVRTDAKLINISTMRHKASSKTNTTSAANTKTLGGLTQEEALKRMLLSVEDALVALGRLAPFDLTRQIRNASPARLLLQGQPSFSSLEKFGNASRLGNPLQSLHRDCRSASSLALYQNKIEDGDLDVFGDEVGPYRPHRDSIRSTLGKKRHSVDPISSRSISGDTVSLTWKQQQQQQQQQQLPPLEIHRKMSDRGAPLAPSVLLDLLNRGQHFAHTAH